MSSKILGTNVIPSDESSTPHDPMLKPERRAVGSSANVEARTLAYACPPFELQMVYRIPVGPRAA